jgi:hypothetical protein
LQNDAIVDSYKSILFFEDYPGYSSPPSSILGFFLISFLPDGVGEDIQQLHKQIATFLA